MPSIRHSSLKRLDSNWRPWSVVIFAGTPKRAIHVERRAEEAVVASISGIGVASGQREKRSIHVTQYRQPCDYCMTMMSKCICSNRPASSPNVSVSVDTCLVILHCWHGMHCRVHVWQFLFNAGQTKRDFTSFWVARIPGWQSPWSELNTSRRKGFGTYGRTMSPDTLQYICAT